MSVSITNKPAPAESTCAVDQSCTNNGCGCTTNHSTSNDDMPRRKTLGRAGIVGLLCVLGCAAGPLAIGGLAAAAGALSGEVWILAAGLLIAAAVYIYRHRTGRRGC